MYVAFRALSLISLSRTAGCPAPVASTAGRSGTCAPWISRLTPSHARMVPKARLGTTFRGHALATMRLKYVHEYIDRSGTIRRYFRRRGFPKIALPGLPGSREFREAYEAAFQADPPPKAAKGGPGSLSDLVTTWCRSPHFANLSPSSQATYRKVLKPI